MRSEGRREREVGPYSSKFLLIFALLQLLLSLSSGSISVPLYGRQWLFSRCSSFWRPSPLPTTLYTVHLLTLFSYTFRCWSWLTQKHKCRLYCPCNTPTVVDKMASMYCHNQDTLLSLIFQSVILFIQMKSCLWFAGGSLSLLSSPICISISHRNPALQPNWLLGVSRTLHAFLILRPWLHCSFCLGWPPQLAHLCLPFFSWL